MLLFRRDVTQEVASDTRAVRLILGLFTRHRFSSRSSVVHSKDAENVGRELCVTGIEICEIRIFALRAGYAGYRGCT
jgi:hypothetical protein